MTTNLVRIDHYLVFIQHEPIDCPHPFESEIRLDESKLDELTCGPRFLDVCVGIDPGDNHHFRIFPAPVFRARAGFHQVIGIPVIVEDWKDFVRSAEDCGEVVV